jgi:putative ABC transport system permease protein
VSLLPFSYAVRNLWRRRARTIATVLGVGLISVLVALMAGFARGLADTTARSASDDVVLFTATDEQHDLVRSAVSLDGALVVATNLPGVATRGDRRLAAPELHVATRRGAQVGLVRGVEPEAYWIHERLTVVEGREPSGAREVIVGRLAESRLGLPPGSLSVGSTVELEAVPWTVVGRFAAPGTVLEAEIWARLRDLMDATRRTDVSCVAARLEDRSRYEEVDAWVKEYGVPYAVAPITERELYAGLVHNLAPIATLAWIMAALVLVGGVFACANTMFAAVLARTRETGTLRALGYGPFAVGFSLFTEAILLGAVGGVLGYHAAGLFGEVPLRFPLGAFYLDLSPAVRSGGLLAALLAGLFGGLVPAFRAVRLSIPDALGDRM